MNTITIDAIKAEVIAAFDLRPIEMVSRRRSRGVARPRQVAMLLAFEFTPSTLREIGQCFGDRDHTTVKYAIKTIERLCEEDAALKKKIETIRAQLAA